MAIFDRVPPEHFGTTFTHRGWFCGLVPVYIGAPESEAPLLVERNWCPEWWFAFAEGLFGMFCSVATAIDADFEPQYPILITGVIEPT